VSRNVTPPALLVKVALPAVEVLLKFMLPLSAKATFEPPAVALFVKFIAPGPGAKFCTIPELFVMPVPLMVKVVSSGAIVNRLAPGLNTMPVTWVAPSGTTNLTLEVAKVAVSFGPLGAVAGVQLLPVLQFPVAGFAFQVALPATLLLAVASRSIGMARAEGRKGHTRGRRND
jgi:hypothetical protein